MNKITPIKVVLSMCFSACVSLGQPYYLQYSSSDDLWIHGGGRNETGMFLCWNEPNHPCPGEDPNDPAGDCGGNTYVALSPGAINKLGSGCINELHCRHRTRTSICSGGDVVEYGTADSLLETGWNCWANKTTIHFQGSYSGSHAASLSDIIHCGDTPQMALGRSMIDPNTHFYLEVPDDGILHVDASRVTYSATGACASEYPVSATWRQFKAPSTALSWSGGGWPQVGGTDEWTGDPNLPISSGSYLFSAHFYSDSAVAALEPTPSTCSQPGNADEDGDASVVYVVHLRYYWDCVLIGDIDADGDVDTGDLAILLSAYGTSATNLESDYNPDADLDGDGDVDLTDYSIWASNNGHSC